MNAAALLVAAFLLPGTAPVACTPQEEDIRPAELRQFEELREEVRVLALFERAKLTREQAASLLEIAAKVADALKGLAAEYEDRLAEARELLQESRRLLAKGEPLSGELRQKIETLQRDSGEVQQALGRRVAPILAEVRGVLSDEQLQTFAAQPSPDGWGPLRQQLEQGIRQVRSLGEDEFELHVPDLLDQQLERISERFGVQLSQDEYRAENKRIMELLREARKLDDDELRAKSSSIVSKILEEGKLGEFGRRSAGQPRPGGRDLERLANVLFNPIVIRALKARRDGER